VYIDLRRIAHIPLIAVLAYFASGAELFVFQATSIPPLWAQIVGLGLMIAWIGATAVATNGRALIVSRPIAAVFVALILYAFVTALSFTYSVQNEIVVETLIARIKAIVFIIVVSLILLDANFRARFTLAAAALAVFGSILAVVDFIEPTFSTVPGRGAGFYLNSNEAAMILVALGLIGSMRLKVVPAYVLWTIISVGVLATFSRTGWLLLFLALLAITVEGRLGGGRARYFFLAAVGSLLAGLLAAYLSGDLYTWINTSSLAEYLDPNTLARLGARGVALDDYSATERADVFWYGLEHFLKSPFIGWGVGYGNVWQEAVNTHNMPLALAVDIGLIGPLFYFGFFTVLIIGNRGLIRFLSIILVVGGMSSHNQLEFIADALIIAFAIASMNDFSRKNAAPARQTNFKAPNFGPAT